MVPTAADRAAPYFSTTVGHTPWHCGQNKPTFPWVVLVIGVVTATRKSSTEIWCLDVGSRCFWASSALLEDWVGVGIGAGEALHLKQSFLGDSNASSERGTSVLMWTVTSLIWRDGLLIRNTYCSEEVLGCSSPNPEAALWGMLSLWHQK